MCLMNSYLQLQDAFLRRILSYLRFWDLLPARLVCRRWNSEIMNHTTFAHRSFILLSPERLPVLPELVPQFLDRLNPSISRLRMIRIPRSHLTPPFEADFVKNLVQLELLYCSTMTWSTLIEILTSCPCLVEFTIRRTVFKWPYDAEEWRSKFPEFCNSIQRSGKSFPALKSVEFRVKDPHDVLYMCKFILENSTALERLSFSCKSPVGGLKLNSGNDDEDDMYETLHELFQVLVEILKKFGQTLHTFHSYLIDPPISKVTPIGSPSSSAVLHNKSPNSNFHGRDNSIMNVYCSEVLSKVDWSKIDLKSFCLYGGEISTSRIPTETDILASVLSSQQSLEKVILPRMKFHTEREFQKFLHFIPKGIKCIRVPTFGRMPESISFEFHKLTEYYIEAHGTPDLQVIVPPETILPNVKTFSFYNCSDWVWQTVRMTTIINSFPCLTELLIRDDGTHQCTRIGDTDLQNICRYLPQLKKLHMTNVDCVTDFGFTGICERECKFMNEVGSFIPSPGTKIGYSIASLTRLEYLCLFKIGFRVTNISLVLGFTFPCLRCLMLEGYPKVKHISSFHLACILDSILFNLKLKVVSHLPLIYAKNFKITK